MAERPYELTKGRTHFQLLSSATRWGLVFSTFGRLLQSIRPATPWALKTTPADSPSDGYRPEIDGLRALSVGLILLFHLDVSRFSGGFVGVDCFFVISGYLITRNLRARLQSGAFRFRDFYAGRIRRLFPALAITLIGTLVAGAAILSPYHLASLGRTTLSAGFFLSNLYFYSEVGYFDLGSEFKPLLHTWSLGVEEQFYLVWPILLFLTARAARPERRFPLILLLIGLMSWGAAEWVIRFDPSAAFFLLPFRMVEFAIGAICIDLERLKPKAWIGEIIVALGLVFIVRSATNFEIDTVFPGTNALLPCVGTALVIWAASVGWLTSVLQWSPVVWIGRLSYSIYLVHWPLIIFYKYTHSNELETMDRIILAATALMMSLALHHLIENPFRFGIRTSTRRIELPVLASSALAVLILASASVWVVLERGFPGRFDNSMQAAAASLPEMKARHFFFAHRQAARPFPIPNRRNGVIIGDSHAADLLSALIMNGSSVNYRHLSVPQKCQLTLEEREWGEGTGLNSKEMADICNRASIHLQHSPDLRVADVIVVASTWTARGLAGFPELVAMLQEKYPGQLVLMGPRFFLGDPSRIIAKAETPTEANLEFDSAKNTEENREIFDALAKIARDRGIEMIDLRPITCSLEVDQEETNYTCPLFDSDGTLLYWDWHHWTFDGLTIFGRRLKSSPEASVLF